MLRVRLFSYHLMLFFSAEYYRRSRNKSTTCPAIGAEVVALLTGGLDVTPPGPVVPPLVVVVDPVPVPGLQC